MDPASEAGPKLQDLMNSVGTATREDLDTDVLWLANAPVEHLTPEEVEQLENGR